MQCIIDAREAFSPALAGKGQWTLGFLTELRTRSVGLTVLAAGLQTESECVRLRPGPFWHVSAAFYARKSDADLYVSPTSYIVPFILGRSMPFIPIIHDLIAFQSEPHDRKASLVERLLLPRVVFSAAHICTASTATKRDLLERFPDLSEERVTPIFAGPLREEPPLSEPDGKTILCVGTLCPRKNQLRLIRAFASLPYEVRTAHQLILVGKRGWADADIVRLARETPGVQWRDYVPDDEYERLLFRATVFAYPSLYEGFGMQVLDALQRGIPVLTSREGSLQEVAGDAALMVDPRDERSISCGLAQLLSNAEIRGELRKRGPEQAAKFSWKHSVDLFLNVAGHALY